MQVIDLLLADSCFKDLRPHFLIVPLQIVKLSGQVKQSSLIELDLVLPLGQNDLILEASVEKLAHVISVKLSVVSECL